MTRLSAAVVATLLAVAAPAPAAAAAGRRTTRSCDPDLVLCVDTDAGYSPGFQEPRFYSVDVVGVRQPPVRAVLAPPTVGVTRVIPSYGLLPPAYPVLPRAYPVLPRAYPVVPRAYPVVPRAYPVVPQPYLPSTRLFPTYPSTLPGRPDIRSFYQSAVLVGDGVVREDGHTAELICDFTTNGPYPSSDTLTDVVWQRVGGDGEYLNTPMRSGATNVLSCPRDYVVPPPVNYGFNVVGTRTSLVIQNSGPPDYGTYRCYATRVNRLNPADRHPVYMEIHYSPITPRTGIVG